ncbi:MAG: hypothetical protein ACREQ5_00250 [Candidatus Dormibacteria bacterium]
MNHDTSYTHIRRGPMGGDHYTQIHNGVFRDKTLTPNAKAIFGLVSTHHQGWGTSIEAIAEAVGIGHDATKRAIQLLKRRHYLTWGQDRNSNGTVRQGWLFLTDLPAQLAEAGVTEDVLIGMAVADALESWKQENRRSGPVVEIQPTGSPGSSPQVGTGRGFTAPPVQPLAVPERTKKTREPQEDQELQEDQKPSSSLAKTDISHDLDPNDFDAVHNWVQSQADGLEGNEDNLLLAMWDRDEPPLKILRTILKQRG